MLLIGLLAASGLFAGGKQEAAKAAPGELKDELVNWTWTYKCIDEWLVPGFNKVYPNIKIKTVPMAKARVPLIHHLDHCTSPQICFAAVDHGYPSVMIDASMHPLEENIRTVRQVVQYAHARGVMVEGEVGRIKGAGFEGGADGDDFLARVEEVARLVEETEVDSLAVGVGTAHGFYQGRPEIRFDRLREINAAVPTPLVLHGGTGIPEADVRRAIRGGINKVNVGTIIHCTYMNAVRAELARRGENAYTLDVMKPARAAVREEVKKWIRCCMADGKA
jgi:ketose-bisphosphate aldolase